MTNSISTGVFQHSFTRTGSPAKINTSAGFSKYRTVVVHEYCTWNNQLQNRFSELLTLPVGWDGYEGKPLSGDCYSFAMNILNKLCLESVPAPSLVPGGDGSLQMEWHINQYDIEIDVLGVYDVSACRYDHRTNQTDEIEITKDFTQVYDWISAIASDRENANAAAA